jgi:predicted small metal-binding protein
LTFPVAPREDRLDLSKEAHMTRYYVDCREMPSETNCDLAMAGSEEHLVEAAAMHAVTAHKHEDTPELRDEIRGAMKEEVPGALA